MPTTPPPIDPVPTPVPQRGDRTTFSSRVDAFIVWLINAVTQFGAVATNVFNNAAEAFGYAQQAQAQANAAQAQVNVPKWVSGTTYADGVAVWSPVNRLTYRRIGAGGGTLDPSLDTTNWAPSVGTTVQTVTLNSNYTALPSDKGRNLSFSASGTLALTAAATLGNGWFCYVQNNCFPSGTVTIDPNGAETLQGYGTYTLGMYGAALITSDGTSIRVMPFSMRSDNRFGTTIASSATINLDSCEGEFVYISGSGDITAMTLSAGSRKTLIFTGNSRLVNGSSLVTINNAPMALAAGATVTVVGLPGGGVQVVGFGAANTGAWQIQDQKASGSAGGAATAATENVRALNTTVGTNGIAGSAMGTNQFTLPAGTYDVDLTAPVYACNLNRVRLYNVTDAAYTLSGQNSFALDTGQGATSATLRGRFTITAAKTFEVRHYIQTNGGATSTLGRAVSQAGVVEVYTDIMIEKIA